MGTGEWLIVVAGVVVAAVFYSAGFAHGASWATRERARPAGGDGW